MRKFKSKKKLLTLLCFAVIASSQAKADSLLDSVHIALHSSPAFKAAKAAKKIADNNLRESYSGFLPSIDLSTSYARDKNTNNTTRADITNNGSSLTLTKRESSVVINQMLFDGFSVLSSVNANCARVRGSENSLSAALNDVVIRVIEAYLDVLKLKSQVEYAKSNLANHQEIAQQIQLRSESGVAKKADKDQASARLALARTNLLRLQANLRDADANYIRVTGVMPKNLVRPNFTAEALLPKTEEAAVAMAVTNHPNLISANYDVEAAKAEKLKAVAAYYPNVNLQLSGTDNKNVAGSRSKTDSLTAEINLSYNLFRGGADRAKEKGTAWSLEQTKQTRNQTRRQVEQSMRLSWNAYVNAKSQLPYLKQHVEAITKTWSAYQEQFRIGQRTLLDLLDSQNELFQAKTTFVSGQYDELLGKFRVLHSMGKIREYFNIPMPKAAEFPKDEYADGF